MIAVAALVFLFLPAAVFGAGVRAGEFENRRLASFPSIGDGWAFFTGLTPWSTDHLPLRQQAVRADGRIRERVFGDSPGALAESTSSGFPEVVFGKDGFWFYGGDFEKKCHPLQPISVVVNGLNALDAALRRSGRTLVVVSPPDKSTIDTDKLPDRFRGKECAAASSAAFWSAMVAVPAFVNLLQDARQLAATSQRPLYPAKDTHWDGPGPALMVRRIVERLDPAVAATFRQRPAGAVSRVADLAVLLGREDREVVDYMRLADPRVVPDPAPFKPPSKELARYRATGPPGTVVASPTLLLGDSFTAAAASALSGVFADLTVLHQSTAGLNPELVVAQILAARFVVVEIVERDLAGGAIPLLNPNVVEALNAQLPVHPWGK